MFPVKSLDRDIRRHRRVNRAAVPLLLLVAVLAGFYALSLVRMNYVATPDATSGYQVMLLSSSGVIPLDISASGAGCERLAGSLLLESVCGLAVKTDPPRIGGAAFGDLNNRITPAYHALVWRARLGAGPDACSQGGLTGSFLEQCRRDAVDPTYSLTDTGLTVQVPLKNSP